MLIYYFFINKYDLVVKNPQTDYRTIEQKI